MTIRTRLTLWYGAVLASTLLALGILIWLSTAAILRASVDEALQVQAADVRSALTRDVRVSIANLDPGQPGIFTAIFGPDGALRGGGRGVPPGLEEPSGGATEEQPLPAGPTYALLSEAAPDSSTIVVGTSLDGVDRTLERFALVLAGCGLVGFVASLLGGWLLSGRALRQVGRLTNEAAEIGSADLDRRLAEPHGRDEIGRLAQTLNGMLDRVAASVRRERAFIAAASHDLRTPISALRTELELAAREPDDSPGLRRAVETAHADAVRLSALAADLLGLAESQASGRALVRTPVSVATLIEGAVSAVRPLASLRKTRIAVEAREGVVDVDRVRLEQAIVNLLSNAIRESPPGSTIQVTADVTADGLAVEVLDHGPGVAADVRPLLFIPFAAKARGRSDGTGLGLATAAAAVHAHGGEIRYEDRPAGGAAFRFRVPLKTPSRRSSSPIQD